MKLTVTMNPGESTWGLRYLLFQLAFLPTLIALAAAWLYPQISGAQRSFVYYLVNFLSILWIFRKFLSANIPKKPICFILTVASGFAVYQVLNLLLSAVTSLLMPEFVNVNDAAITQSIRSGYGLMFIGTVFLVPPVEETLYRGLVFGALRSKGRLFAYGVSTLIFCAIHVAGYVGRYEPLVLLVCFLQYIPAGLVLAWAYETADSIYAPILIHMAVNAIGMFRVR